MVLSSIRPMQHSLAYLALASKEIDLTDAYTTDGTPCRSSIWCLKKTTANGFPGHYGVVVARAELPQLFPGPGRRCADSMDS